MEDLSRAEPRWVFSLRGDLTAAAAPVAAAAAAAPLLLAHTLPNEQPQDLDDAWRWAYVAAVHIPDVAHVYTTLFRCYLDTRENRRRWALYNLSPFAVFAAVFAAHWWGGEAVCWQFIGYFAIWHFIKQQWGFIALYRGRARDTEPLWVDKAAHWAGAGLPIALWHCDATRPFDWFLGAEYPPLLRLPGVLRPAFAALWAGVLLCYAARQAALLRGGGCNAGKLLVMACNWVSWGVGIMGKHELVGTAFTQVCHAVPSFMITYFVCRNRFRREAASTAAERFVEWTVAPGRWGWYLAFFLVLGTAEEMLWEAFVWHDHLPDEYNMELGPLGRSVATAALAVPQVTHYFLDGFIWRPGSNPGLARDFGFGGAPKRA